MAGLVSAGHVWPQRSQIWPREIEEVISAHPAVLESAAHAVPSDLGEDEVKVAVVPKPGEQVTPRWCMSRAASSNTGTCTQL